MILFFKKYHSGTTSFLFQFLIQLAIIIRALLSFIVAKTVSLRSVLIDIVLINLSLQISLVIYEALPVERTYDIDHDQIFIWNIIITLLYLVFGKYEVQNKRFLFITNLAKSISFAFLGLVVVTFFFKTIAFSRLIILIGFLLSLVMVTLSNVLLSNRSKLGGSIGKKWFRRRVLVVGSNPKTPDLIKKLRSFSSIPIDVLGVIHQDNWEPGETYEDADIVPVIGSLAQTKTLVKDLHISHIVVLMDAIKNYELLEIMSLVKEDKVKIAIVPKDLDVLIGKDIFEGLKDLSRV
jgi:FlaA1/EpsC-like NDP-sugar epimerase